MYSLTLTHSERTAIDWIGDRYATGSQFRDLLEHDDCLWTPRDDSSATANWDWDCDITYTIPEHIAWKIREEFEQDNYEFPCFAPEFASKLQQFAMQIV